MAAAAGGAAAAAAVPTAQVSDEEDEEEEGDDHRIDWDRGGFAALTSNLFSHQKTAVRWLLKVERTAGLQGGILADEMGLGKTVSLLGLIAGNTPRPQARGGRRLPTLVVLPLSLLNQWNREIRAHTRGLKTHVYYGDGRYASAAELSDTEIVLTTYDVLVIDDAAAQEDGQQRGTLASVTWHRLVCDEAAFIKNLDTKRAKAVYKLKTTHAWMVTGSPVQNNIKELQTLLKMCKFRHSDVDRSWRSLCRHVLLRRTMATVATEVGTPGGGLKMPKLTEEVRTLGWSTTTERETYRALEAKAKAIKAGVYTELLSNVMRMRQACNHPSLASTVDQEDAVSEQNSENGPAEPGAAAARGDSGEETDEEGGSGRLVGAKLDALMSVLAEAKKSGEKVLVFSFFKRFLDLVARMLQQRGVRRKRIVRLHGSMSAHERDSEVQRFRSEPAADIFLISTKAGGLGLNLTTASTVVILEPGWNPTDEEQAVRRAYRIGQLRRVRVVRFVVKSTIEEQVIRLQKEKQTLAAAVLTSGPGSTAALQRMIARAGDGGAASR